MAKQRRKRRSKAGAAHAASDAAPPEAPKPSAARAIVAPEHSPQAQSESDAAALRSPRRIAANLFIAAFVAYQLAMPLRYYLNGGGYDERFSWRMFSSLRMQKCQVGVEDLAHAQDAHGRDVQLPVALHVAWIRILERARPAVVHKFLRSRCGEADVAGARYLLQCVDPGGQVLPDRTVTYDCASGRFDDSTASQGAGS